MKINKQIFCIILVISIITILLGYFYLHKDKYDYNKPIMTYKLNKPENKNKYLDNLKKDIKPTKIKNFVDNRYVSISAFDESATGEDILQLMYFMGYKMLFMSMFDKERVDFEDCPVTENFKEKFNTNLLNYFNLVESEDCESNCLLNREDKEITVEVYGNFKNTEPTYWTTHHFHYTLDDEGNVDDVVFDYTEK